MNIRLKFAIITARFLIKFLRIFKSGATSLPGRIAYLIYPDILKNIAPGKKIIMVTGTNGKTTTTRIIEQILKENNATYITNKSGANLASGITTALISALEKYKKGEEVIALLEIDEAAFRVVAEQIEPDILVITNFFRDQLDRYGELYTTRRNVIEGINKLKSTRLVVNADDSLCASIGKDTDKKTLYFGFGEGTYTGLEESGNSDAMYCIYCKTKYNYSNRIYGHLGEYKCPSCGFSKPKADIACVAIKELTSKDSKIEISNNKTGENFEVKVNLPGIYNVYNALAGISVGYLMDFPNDNTLKAIENFECGFGRMETIIVQGKTIKIILVKNPTGFNQVINFLLTEDKSFNIAFLLNDNIADGTDVSWIWDVDIEKLQNTSHLIKEVFASGIRAEDMAVRLKYSGFSEKDITIEKDYNKLIDLGLNNTEEGHNFYILPTYTALLDMRKLLENKFKIKEFWK